MKKTLVCILALAMALGLLTACGKQESGGADGGNDSGQRKQIETLRIAFVPSADADATLAAAQPLDGLLKSQLAERGYDVGSIVLSVGESYEAVGEALRGGEADIGVGMPGGTYVLYEDGCDAILTATRAGLNKNFDDPREWNDEMPTVMVDKQTVSYRSLIIAGPSEKGRALAAKVNAGQELTWDDLNGARWALMGESSSAGYIYPALWLQEHCGKSAADLSSVVRPASYTDAFAQLAAGEVDVLATYADARCDYALSWSGEFGREESIWGETDVIGVTPAIYNDAIAVSKASAVMDADFVAALQEVFMDVPHHEESRDIIALYSHEGYQKAVAADYDNERAAQQLMRSR